jgi:hypothetical protein
LTEHSKSLLFLMEQVIVITVFAVCAAVCVSLFASSFETARASSDLNKAMLLAASGAEAAKASDNAAQTAAFLGKGAAAIDGGVTVFYDSAWLGCDEDQAAYLMDIVFRPGEPGLSLTYGDITVKSKEGEEIFSLTAAARWDTDE